MAEVMQANNSTLMKVIDDEKCLISILTLIHLKVSLQFSCLDFTVEILSPRKAISALAMAMMGIVAPTLLTTKSESGKSTAICNPQNVMRQLAHNQGTLRVSRDMGTSNVLAAEARIIRKGKD